MDYQVFVWIHSQGNRQCLPDLDKSGWKINGEKIKYDWVKGNLLFHTHLLFLIVPEQLIDSLCEQNVEGDVDKDRDNDDGNDDEGDEKKKYGR